MECVLNRIAVDQLLHQKGRQYKGQQGKYLAATKIQVCITLIEICVDCCLGHISDVSSKDGLYRVSS